MSNIPGPFPIPSKNPSEITATVGALTGNEAVYVVQGGAVRLAPVDEVAARAPTGGSAAVTPYDVTIFFAGIPSASDTIRIAIPRVCSIYSVASLPVGVAHQCIALSAAAMSVSIDLRVNGVSVGSISISAGANVGVYTLATGISLAAGDVIEAIMPAIPDSALSGIAITLAGAI